MKHALSNIDILSYMFSEAVRDKRTLAASARVCRQWFEPAIRILWKDIDEMDILFRLLPVCHDRDGRSCYASILRTIRCLTHDLNLKCLHRNSKKKLIGPDLKFTPNM